MQFDIFMDALVKLKNGENIGKRQVRLHPTSKLLARTLKVMQDNGYIGEYEYIENGRGGVVDEQNRVNGYENMLIVDASMIPANLGVNPALSITALSERAMSFIPVKKGEIFKSLKVEKEWGVSELFS